MAFSNFKYLIEENAKSNFEPIIRATSIIDFFDKILDVTPFQIISFFDKEIAHCDIRSIVITDNNNYGFIDKNKTMKVFNAFSITHGFSFTLLQNIAFISKVDVDDVYIVVQDLKDALKELYNAIPKSEIKYIDKSKLNHLAPNKKANTPHYQEDQIAELQAQLQEKNARIAELEGQLEFERASNQEKDVRITEIKRRLDPREKVTYCKLIYALSMARTNKDFSAPAYFKANGDLNVHAIITEIISELENIDGQVKDFSQSTLRKSLAKILKMENLKAE